MLGGQEGGGGDRGGRTEQEGGARSKVHKDVQGVRMPILANH